MCVLAAQATWNSDAEYQAVLTLKRDGKNSMRSDLRAAFANTTELERLALLDSASEKKKEFVMCFWAKEGAEHMSGNAVHRGI